MREFVAIETGRQEQRGQRAGDAPAAAPHAYGPLDGPALGALRDLEPGLSPLDGRDLI